MPESQSVHELMLDGAFSGATVSQTDFLRLSKLTSHVRVAFVIPHRFDADVVFVSICSLSNVDAIAGSIDLKILSGQNDSHS